MYAAEARGEVPKGTAKEWAQNTNFKSLPEKLSMTRNTVSALGGLEGTKIAWFYQWRTDRAMSQLAKERRKTELEKQRAAANAQIQTTRQNRSAEVAKAVEAATNPPPPPPVEAGLTAEDAPRGGSLKGYGAALGLGGLGGIGLMHYLNTKKTPESNPETETTHGHPGY